MKTINMPVLGVCWISKLNYLKKKADEHQDNKAVRDGRGGSWTQRRIKCQGTV